MSEASRQQLGTVAWVDLTVPDAEPLRQFYERVAGWKSVPVEMGGYADHSMLRPGADAPVAGICHARGDNAGLPPAWLIYIVVASLDESLRHATALGGAVVSGPRSLGPYGRMAVIRDPAGAFSALVEPPAESVGGERR